jgi:hypothetical protein
MPENFEPKPEITFTEINDHLVETRQALAELTNKLKEASDELETSQAELETDMQVYNFAQENELKPFVSEDDINRLKKEIEETKVIHETLEQLQSRLIHQVDAMEVGEEKLLNQLLGNTTTESNPDDNHGQ